jgi:hypothetical protein
LKIWLRRPLPPELEFGIVSDVAYLLDLHRTIPDSSSEPVRRMSNVLLATLRHVGPSS